MVAVGVAVLFVIITRRVVSEHLICLGHLNEHVISFGVALVLVRVVDEREASVGLLDIAHLRALVDTQDLERVERKHIRLLHGRELASEEDEQHPRHRKHGTAPAEDFSHRLLSLSRVHFLMLLFTRAHAARPIGRRAAQREDANERLRNREYEATEHGEQKPVEGDIVEDLERHLLTPRLSLSALAPALPLSAHSSGVDDRQPRLDF